MSDELDDIPIETGDAPEVAAEPDRSAEIEVIRQKITALGKQLDAECAALVERTATRLDETAQQFERKTRDIEAEALAALNSITARVGDLRAKIELLRRGG